jgi:hypothetical protein
MLEDSTTTTLEEQMENIIGPPGTLHESIKPNQVKETPLTQKDTLHNTITPAVELTQQHQDHNYSVVVTCEKSKGCIKEPLVMSLRRVDATAVPASQKSSHSRMRKRNLASRIDDCAGKIAQLQNDLSKIQAEVPVTSSRLQRATTEVPFVAVDATNCLDTCHHEQKVSRRRVRIPKRICSCHDKMEAPKLQIKEETLFKPTNEKTPSSSKLELLSLTSRSEESVHFYQYFCFVCEGCDDDPDCKHGDHPRRPLRDISAVAKHITETGHRKFQPTANFLGDLSIRGAIHQCLNMILE